ncbi:glycosyltransferase family 4 protein [Luteibacter jiangsuensis]|uniref:Glycosyltransferase family 4 protein n=1 Tax=Luteibacter jiangsuensis TaxID=637577 RepID=A0ABX0Q2X4_9GAMM|nr:glycosyltransferase family 4 protein [Luteibacter jiangsuensis]
MASIHLIACDNGRGLSHDIRLLEAALRELGHTVSITPVPRRSRGLPWRAWWQALRMHLHWLAGRGPRRYDLGITLEHVHTAYLALARRNALVPNPEWLSRRDRRQLHRFDAILCKTEVARATFEAQGLPVHVIGFQSIDCRREGIARDRSFLHLAGASRMKGTERLLEVWRRHPEWPTLHVLQSPSTARTDRPPAAANLDHRVAYVDDIETIRRLQNAHAFHVCLSEAEGWGHYIVEAMSCGAVVLTTDAPPMNELVSGDRGLLVHATESGTLNASALWQFDEAALEACVAKAAAMPDEEVNRLGRNARAWYERNQAGFAERLRRALDALL